MLTLFGSIYAGLLGFMIVAILENLVTGGEFSKANIGYSRIITTLGSPLLGALIGSVPAFLFWLYLWWSQRHRKM